MIKEEMPVLDHELLAASALYSALLEGGRRTRGLDERPIEALLRFALTVNPWMGPELFGFPGGLTYRTQGNRNLADVAGFQKTADGSFSDRPTAQIEFKRYSAVNYPKDYRTQFDCYLAHHGGQDNLVLLVPEFRKAYYAREVEAAEIPSVWRLVTFAEVLKKLEARGIADLEDGFTKTLLLNMLRA